MISGHHIGVETSVDDTQTLQSANHGRFHQLPSELCQQGAKVGLMYFMEIWQFTLGLHLQDV